MAFKKFYMNEMFGTLLVLSALLSTTSALDCYGKSFRCVNSTHFMICVDLGGGVSQGIEDFYIACPPPTLCQGNNHFECEFPAPPTPDTTLNNAITETTLPWEEIVTVSSLNNTNKEFSENYMDTTVEKGTTTAIEYSVTTDTTVDVTSKTVADIYINNEFNVTEVAATIPAETTTTPVEIILQTLNEVNIVTQTTENIPTTGIESVAQSTADTINLTPTPIVVAGEESITSAIDNTQATTENKVITEIVTEQPAPITTEQIIQTTTNDPLEQEPSSLYTDLPQVITLFQNVSLTTNTLLKESPVVNENIQTTEKTKIFSLDNGTKNNIDLVPISETANVIQPDIIFQNVEITSTVESIVEITTASIEHLTSIPSDKILTDVYHGPTASSFDNKLKLNPSGLHEDTPAPTKLEGSIQSKVTSEKQQNKTSQMNKIKHALDELKHTIGEWVLAPNNENRSTTAYNDVFPELAVTTDLPFVNDVEANANMTNKNVTYNKPITDYTNAKNNKVTTALDGIVATETFGNHSSSDQPTTINEGQLTKDSTQNVVTENFDFVTNADMTNTNVIDNKPITDYYEVTTTLDGIVATKTFGNDSSSDQPTTLNEGQLTKQSTQNAVTENFDFVTNADMTNTNVIDNKPITDYYEVTTTLDGIVTTKTFGIDSSSDQPTTLNEGQLTKQSTQNVVTENFDFVTTEAGYTTISNSNVQSVTTKVPFVMTKSQNSVDSELGGAFIIENIETTASTEQLTKESNQNVVTENFDFVTNANMTNTNFIDNKPITDYYEVTTTPDGIVANKTFGIDSSSDQPTTINEGQLTKESTQNVVTENSDFVTNANMMNTNVIDNKPITDYYEVTTTSDGIVATKMFEIYSSSDQPTTINEGQLTKVSTQNVVTENFDFVTTEAGYTTISNSNVQSVTTKVPFVMTKSQNSVDSELGGAFIIENVETTASTEQLITTSKQSLIIGTTQNFVTENDFIPTNEAINQGIVSSEAINKPTIVLTAQPMMTEVPSFVTIIQNFEDTTLDPALKVNEETITTDTPAIITAQPMVTEGPHTKRQKLITQNLDETDLDRRFITENVENTASTEQPTTVYEQRLTVDTNQNVVAKNDFISTSKVYQGIVSLEARYEPTTMTNLHSTTKMPNFDDKKIDSASIVEFGTGTEQIKTINEETRATNTPDIVNAKPMMTEVPSAGSKTQNSAGMKLGEEFINKTTENIGSMKRPNTIHEQSLIVDTTQNDAVENIVIPTSEAVNRGIKSTGAIHESSSIINLQPMTTEASTLVTITQNSENTKQDAAFIIKDVEFSANTDRIGITDTSANVAKEKITIPTNEAVHTVINNTQSPTTELNTTTEALLLTMTVQNPITKHTSKDVAVNTQIKENSAIAEKAITINKGTSTPNTEQNITSENSATPTRHAVNLDITTKDTLYTLTTIGNDNQIPVAAQHISNKAQEFTTPTSVTITDMVLNSEAVGNSVGTTQSTAIKEESVTTDTAHNVATIIIPKTQTGKENKTVKEDVNLTIIISNAQPTPEDNKDNKVPLPSFEHTASITETGSTSVVTSKPVLSLQQKKQQLSDNNLVPGAGRENVVELTSDTYYLTSTNAIELNFNMEPTMVSIQGDTVIIDKGWNPMDLTTPSDQIVNVNDHTILNNALSNDKHLKASAINIDHNGYANQDHFKIGTIISSNEKKSGISVPENLPSLQYITHGISKENSNNIDLSTSQAPGKKSNYISNQAFMSQHGKSETMLVTNDAQFSTVQANIIEHNNKADNVNSNPLQSYLIDKSNQNLESARKSSGINLNVEENDVDTALPDIEFVSQQPTKSTLPASSSISDGPNNLKQSTTGTKISTQISTNGLLENIKKVNSEPEVDTLPAPEYKLIAKEDQINLKTSTLASGILADVSSSTTVPTGTTVVDTTMVDSIQNAYETITAFFRPGSKSTVDEAGNNIGELGSNANVFPDKIESEYPKNSNDPIPPSQSVIYQYKLTTNSQDFSETTSTKGDIITGKVNAPRKPLMLNVLPVPINKVGLRSSVKNIPVITDLTTQAQNGNIIQITESYKSVTFNPALTNTGTHAGINGVDITTAPTLRNPTLKLQAGVTDKGNASPKSPTFGDSAIVGNLAKNNDVTIFSTLSDVTSNSPTEVIDRTDVSLQQPQLIKLRPVEKISANMPYANILPNTKQKVNKNIQNVLSPILTDMPMGVTLESYQEINNIIPKSNRNVPEDSIANTVYQKTNFTVITDLKYNSQNGSETKSEPQQNNSPTNHALSTQTQKTYASSTVRVPSQSVTQKLIPRTKNITKPVTNDAKAFNCIKGIRGRYSDKDDCRKFYICVGINQPIVGNCPENTVFSDVKKLCTKNLSHCIRQNEFKCPSAGRFSDFMKDNVYYICVSHKNHLYKFKFECQKGYILNKTIVKCIETKEIESNESVSISSSDSSRQTGSTSTVSSSTNSNSISSSTTSNTSNSGDSSSKSEDSSKTKKSNEAEETPEQTEGTKKKDDEDEEVFKCKKEGKFPIRNECRRYYLCKKKGSQYRRRVKKCESGRVFHKDKKKCVDDDDYEC